VLRDVAKHLASARFGLSVMVVDTSHEIAGSDDTPHPCIGASRRLIVQDGLSQHDAMLLAVSNHTPEVIVVDEIVRS
jgi:stage III sporulation protein SpoIIIAA